MSKNSVSDARNTMYMLTRIRKIKKASSSFFKLRLLSLNDSKFGRK